MNDIYYGSSLFLLILIVPAQYFIYKRKAGFKNEKAAMIYFYDSLCGVTFYTWFAGYHTLNIDSIIASIIGLVIIIGGLIGGYFVRKRLVA